MVTREHIRAVSRICVAMSQKKSPSVLKKILLHRFKQDFTFEYLRDQWLKKPAAFLHALHISPNNLSVIGVAFIIIATMYLNHPLIAATLMMANLVADSLDGVLARLYQLNTFTGSLVDTICDTLGSIAVVIGFSLFYKLDMLQTTLWSLSIIFYSITTALYSIKVQQRSKVLGFRNVINIGAIILLLCLSFQLLEKRQVPDIVSLYMHSISIILVILSLYASLRIFIIEKMDKP